jgi:alpha-L-rhamnosidase
VLAQIDLEDADGRVQRIITDETWTTHPSPNTLVGKWDFMDFGGEHYDASREIAGWAAPGLDDSAWKPAVVFSPKLAVSADRVEPNRRLTELAATAVTEPESGVYRVDFGRNVAGMFEFAIAGQPGDRIEFQFSERENQPVTHRLRSSYVIGPSGRGTFQHRFNYATARWVTIRGLRQAPAARDCRAWLVRSSFADATAFECSNPLLNDIAATTRWTLENLALGGYIVDCPQRERMGYGGDGHATTTTALNLFRTGAFFTKWAEDWRDVQGRGASWGVGVPAGQAGSGSAAEEGNLPYTAPTYWGGGGPAWSGYCIHLPWEVYRHYGDTRILGENFAMIERWLAFLETKSRDDLLRRWGGQWDFLGDWLWPGAPPNPVPPNSNGDRRDTLCLNNCYWIYNLTTAARIADVLGRTDEAAAWRQRADTVRRAVHREFFNAGDASYDNGFQAVLAQALLNELPPTDARPAVWRRLEREILVVRGGHIHAGITGGAFLFKLLMEARRDDLIHTMVNQREYPGWGFMLAKGATTIWEIWEDEARHSRLHSSYLYVGAWFIHGVLGLQPDPAAPGFARFAIRPAPLDRPDLTWARGHHDTVHGRIAVEWRRADGQFTLNATVPPGTTALAHLPATSAAVITEAGQPLAMVKGTRFLRVEDDRAVVELGSGSYNFAMPVAR